MRKTDCLTLNLNAANRARRIQIQSTVQRLRPVRQALCLAQKMGTRLGTRAILLGTLPTNRSCFVNAPVTTIRLILGDQLNPNHPWFAETRTDVVYFLAELRQETDYVRHHIQKTVAFFLALEDFAQRLKTAGHRVEYRTLDHPDSGLPLPELLQRVAKQYGAPQIEYLEPDEYRVDQQLREAFGPPADTTHHFLYPRSGVARHFSGKKNYLLESFYRQARLDFGVLLDPSGKPLGGKWNFDAENRKRMPVDHPLPPPYRPSKKVAHIVNRLERHGVQTVGRINTDDFPWPTTPDEAHATLDHFLEHLLPEFGIYQDHLGPQDAFYFHSRLSFSLNCKHLHPLEVIRAVESAHRNDPERISLAQAEGFIRQILGWREYVRGIYWDKMPDYAQLNALNHRASLPHWFWTGQTRMACARHAIEQTLEHAYAHHIQRLMVTGNLALLLGVHPDEVDAWYLGVYIDALEWVEMPNARGMSQYADGGIVGTKPYVSSGQYLKKQSHYCGSCWYSVDQKTGDRACPLNALYWDFHVRHRNRLESLPRIGYAYLTWDIMKPDHQAALLEQAAHWHAHREEL